MKDKNASIKDDIHLLENILNEEDNSGTEYTSVSDDSTDGYSSQCNKKIASTQSEITLDESRYMTQSAPNNLVPPYLESPYQYTPHTVANTSPQASPFISSTYCRTSQNIHPIPQNISQPTPQNVPHPTPQNVSHPTLVNVSHPTPYNPLPSTLMSHRQENTHIQYDQNVHFYPQEAINVLPSS